MAEMEMVERVALEIEQVDWSDSRVVARVAIEAMRHPTESMVAAGVEATDTRNPNDECPSPREIRAAYQAMISAALSDPKEEGQ